MSPTPSLTMSNPTGTFMKLKESWGGSYRKHFQPTTWRRKEQSRASSWKCSVHLSSFHSFSFAEVCPHWSLQFPKSHRSDSHAFTPITKGSLKKSRIKESPTNTICVCTGLGDFVSNHFIHIKKNNNMNKVFVKSTGKKREERD